jgi:hypothetical protein
MEMPSDLDTLNDARGHRISRVVRANPTTFFLSSLFPERRDETRLREARLFSIGIIHLQILSHQHHHYHCYSNLHGVTISVS